METSNRGISNVRINRFLRNYRKTRGIYVNTVACDSKKKGQRFPYAMVMTTDDWRGWLDNAPGHWVAIWVVDENNAEYFDSSGNAPNSCILNYLKGIQNIKTNALELQWFSAPTCGFYSMYFIVRRADGLDFDAIIDELASKRSERDVYVQKFIEDIEKTLFSREGNIPQ